MRERGASACGTPPPPPHLFSRMEVESVKDDALENINKIRDELMQIAEKLKRGDITPSVANSVTNTYRTALYSEQIRLQHDKLEVVEIIEFSDKDKLLLDNLINTFEVEKKAKKGCGKNVKKSVK